MDVERAVSARRGTGIGSRRKKPNASARTPTRGGAAEGATRRRRHHPAATEDPSPPRRPIDSLGVVRGAFAEGAEDPVDEPVRVHRVRRADIPVQVPDDDGAEPSAGPGATNVRAHHPERHPHMCSAAQGGSFDVITAIREANPFASFSWCLGADTSPI